jgi:hypothetical protein
LSVLVRVLCNSSRQPATVGGHEGYSLTSAQSRRKSCASPTYRLCLFLIAVWQAHVAAFKNGVGPTLENELIALVRESLGLSAAVVNNDYCVIATALYGILLRDYVHVWRLFATC